MSEHQTRQVDYGCANDGLLYEEAPDLGPLQEGAEAAELTEACLGSPLVPAAPSSARDPSVRSLVDRPGADRERVHAPLLRPAPPALPARRSVPAARRCRPCPGEQDRSGRVLDHTRPAVAGLVPLARVPLPSGGHERRSVMCLVGCISSWCRSALGLLAAGCAAAADLLLPSGPLPSARFPPPWPATAPGTAPGPGKRDQTGGPKSLSGPAGGFYGETVATAEPGR